MSEMSRAELAFMAAAQMADEASDDLLKTASNLRHIGDSLIPEPRLCQLAMISIVGNLLLVRNNMANMAAIKNIDSLKPIQSKANVIVEEIDYLMQKLSAFTIRYNMSEAVKRLLDLIAQRLSYVAMACQQIKDASVLKIPDDLSLD